MLPNFKWTWVTEDQKIAKLRGILKGLQEENQSTQLLKVESEDSNVMLTAHKIVPR